MTDNCLLSRVVQKREAAKIADVKEIKEFKDIDDCLCEMKTSPAEIVLINSDSRLSGEEAIIKNFKENFPDTSVIMHTSRKSEQQMLACFANGAKSVIFKNKGCDYKSTIEKVITEGFYIDRKTFNGVFSKIKPENKPDLKKSEKLTKRETEVLLLIAKGKSNTEIAKELNISINTVKTQVKNILSKLEAKDRLQAAMYALKSGLADF